MARTMSLVIALMASGMLGGCDRSAGTRQTATAAPVTGQPVAATSSSAATGDALLLENDRAIADNKRMTTMLARYQGEDFVKYERLRKACEAQARGTLADSAAPAVARCIRAGW